jgi:hypothetical protein
MQFRRCINHLLGCSTAEFLRDAKKWCVNEEVKAHIMISKFYKMDIQDVPISSRRLPEPVVPAELAKRYSKRMSIHMASRYATYITRVGAPKAPQTPPQVTKEEARVVFHNDTRRRIHKKVCEYLDLAAGTDLPSIREGYYSALTYAIERYLPLLEVDPPVYTYELALPSRAPDPDESVYLVMPGGLDPIG